MNSIKEQKIFTENPEEEMWRTILQFSYPANIRRYIEEKGFNSDDKLIECISGSILQSYEYYNACKTSNLQISPLLLYYGTTNLLYGMTNLLTGKINEIRNHGMHIQLDDNYKYIAETSIRFENYDNGGVHVFCKALNVPVNLTRYGEWTVKELLGSIAEIYDDYYRCYSATESYVIPLEVTRTENGTIEKVELSRFDINGFKNMFSKVKGSGKSYLNPTVRSMEDEKYLILRHKINGKSIAEISYSDQPYLQVGHSKNGNLITLPTLFYMYIVLFAFGSLCRYNPEKWNPFVRNDSTGERLLVEKLLYFARRMIPNMILNTIYGCRMCFVDEKYHINNTIKVVNEHEVKDLIKKELDFQRRIEEVGKNAI